MKITESILEQLKRGDVDEIEIGTPLMVMGFLYAHALCKSFRHIRFIPATQALK